MRRWSVKCWKNSTFMCVRVCVCIYLYVCISVCVCVCVCVCHTAISIGHAFDTKLMGFDVHDGYTRDLSNASFQIAIAGGDNVTLVLDNWDAREIWRERERERERREKREISKHNTHCFCRHSPVCVTLLFCCDVKSTLVCFDPMNAPLYQFLSLTVSRNPPPPSTHTCLHAYTHTYLCHAIY